MEAADLGLKLAETLVWPLIALMVVLVGARLLRTRMVAAPSQSPVRSIDWNTRKDANTGKVSLSIADAEALIPSEAATSADPIVHLQQAVRISPDQYRDAVRDIGEHYGTGRVVIVDLAVVDENTAVRLVDFCSGLTLGSNGTFFQVSTTVLLLTPRVTVG